MVHEKLPAGLYDENGEMISSWTEMLESGQIEIDDGNLIAPMETQYPGYLYLDDSVTQIPRELFLHHTELKGLHMGDNVKSIGEGACDSCSNLEWIEFSPVFEEAGAYALSDCISLTEIEFPDNMTSYPEGLCQGNKNLISVKLSEKAESIESKAFADCINMERLHTDNKLPDTVKVIGEDAYSHDVKLKSVTIPEQAHCNHNTFDRGATVKRTGHDEKLDIRSEMPKKDPREFALVDPNLKFEKKVRANDRELRQNGIEPITLDRGEDKYDFSPITMDMHGNVIDKMRDEALREVHKRPEPEQKPGEMTDENGKAISDRDWSWCNPRGTHNTEREETGGGNNKHNENNPKQLPEEDQQYEKPKKTKVLGMSFER